MLTRTMMAGLAAAGMALGTEAAAATYYDFQTDSGGTAATLDYGLFAVSSNATFLGFNRPSRVSSGPSGLGVAGLLDVYDPAQLDGFPAGTAEWLTITFDYAVRLSNFSTGLMEFGDEFSYSINGGPLVESTAAFNPIDAGGVTTFSIFAIGTFNEGRFGLDDFTLKGLEVAAVPVPAAGALLLGALGLMGMGARRRSA